MSDEPSGTDAGATFDRDALAADARALVAAIEDHHVDPYAVGYDGRAALHARLERVVRDLPESATAESFYRRAARLVAGMNDAHSRLVPPERAGDDATEDRRLPVSFRVVGDRLYVDAVFDGGVADLLGARLLGVEGESVDALADRDAALAGTENRYHSLRRVGERVADYRPLDRLLDRSESPAEPTLRVDVDGAERSVAVTPVAADREPTDELAGSVPHPAGDGPRYRLYGAGDAAVFVPGDLQGYRESFEVATAAGAEWVDDFAPAAYERHVGGDPPDDVGELVAALPSMTEALADLTDGMADAGTETLIVDLRDNPGGDSQFVFHLAYALSGWEGVARAAGSVRALKRRTDPHRARYGDGVTSGGVGTADTNPADYDFSDFLDGPAEEGRSSEPAAHQRESLSRSETFAEFVASGEYEAACDPDRVVVAVSAGTMSSGFAGAAQLSTLGADVVGVPSGQAPVSFGEAVETTLPTTGLTARIACSMYHWTPDPDPDVLELDRELTPDLFERYGRAGDAGLRLAFDHAGVAVPDGASPVER